MSQKMTMLSAAVLAATVLQAQAAPLPSGGSIIVANTNVEYIGTAEEDAKIYEVDPPNDNGGTDAINVAAGGLSIRGYRDFIMKEDDPEKGWMYGIYAPYAGTITIDVTRDIFVRTDSIAVHTMGDSTISLKAGGNIQLESNGNGVFAQHQSSIAIESTGGDVSISGNNNVLGIMNADTANAVNISLKAAGTISVAANKTEAIKTQTNGGVIALNAAKGVDVTGDIVMATGKLDLTGTSEVRLHENSKADIGTLEGGDVTFYFDSIDSEGKTLSIASDNATETNAVLTYKAVDGLSAQDAADALISGFDVKGSRAAYGTNFEVEVVEDADGNQIVRVDGSDITKQTADLAAMTLVAWRNETTTITDRMASLRTNPQTYGAWVRWNGGAYDFDDRDLSNDFNTIEVGGDMKVDPNWVLGASFSYTKGDGDFAQGETESDAYAGALYALWTHEKGSFLDMVMKTGRISTDFDFYNLKGGATDNGTLDQTGFILSVETGHRFALPMNTFVEPQIQLQYSRLASVDEKTAERRVELDPSISLIGRIGVMAGLEYPNDRGTVWVKASALRDFKGDVDGMVANADGTSSYEISEELDQNWAELALGADVKVTDNVYAFADVQKSFGGDIELDWRANVGAKIVW